jgi:hypothetical protein
MIPQADGKYLCFYDDDNIILPTYLEELSKALDENKGAAFAICQIVHMGPLQKFVATPPAVLTGVPPKLYHIDTLQVMVRTGAIQGVGWDQSQGGFYGDGTTYEILGKRYQWIEVPKILGVHI